jgi:hypothetical protein
MRGIERYAPCEDADAKLVFAIPGMVQSIPFEIRYAIGANRAAIALL